MTAAVFGPYETERDTYAEPLLLDSVNGNGWVDLNRQHLTAAITNAGVTLGAYDTRIIDWICRWEPQATQVLIGVISRAYAAGVEQGKAAIR